MAVHQNSQSSEDDGNTFRLISRGRVQKKLKFEFHGRWILAIHAEMTGFSIITLKTLLYIKPKMHHIPILHDILFAF
jgi:hypothetical protein